jgi:hypothetical protein
VLCLCVDVLRLGKKVKLRGVMFLFCLLPWVGIEGLPMLLLRLGAFWALKHPCGMSMSVGKLGRLEWTGRYCHDVERMIYEVMIDETRLMYVWLRG